MPSYLTIQTPIDTDNDTVKRFTVHTLNGDEGLCRDFGFDIELSTPDRLSDMEIKELVGGNVTIHIKYIDSNEATGTRYINGRVYSISELGVSRTPSSQDTWRYQLNVGSFLRQLQDANDCRIFQKKDNTALTIIKTLLRECGIHDFRETSCDGVPKREYVVMYGESIYNFIIRLLHEEGIIWGFEHTPQKHVLVFSSTSTQNPSINDSSITRVDSVYQFAREANLISIASCESADFNWRSPQAQVVKKSIKSVPSGLRHFEYPGKFEKRTIAEKKLDRRATALNAKQVRYSGKSTARSFEAGKKFTLSSPLILPENHGRQFLILSLKIMATTEKYENRFSAIDAKTPYLPLPEKDVIKPRIFGSQTAIVAGASPSGKQTDEWGRVNVRFHWDHLTPPDTAVPSALIRVAGPAAGNKRGFVFIPKIGEEVVVVFEDGDPDKPLIIGSVYNSKANLPFSPAANPYRSAIKTSQDPDSNQITFEDKPGAERLDIVAKKDMTIDVGGNLDITVKNDITVNAKSLNIKVTKDVKITAGGSILNMALATINNLAGGAISNMAGGGVLNLAGGLTIQAAGGVMTNSAILSVANTSAFGIKQESGGLIANTAASAVVNTGSEVVNNGEVSILNTSGGAIVNTASENINNEAILMKNKSVLSNTEADSYSIKGITKING